MALANTDIYQAFLHATAYGGVTSSVPTAILVYPTDRVVGETERLVPLLDRGVEGIHVDVENHGEPS